MKFGVTIPAHRDIMPVEAMVEVPQRAEELGFDSIWFADHIVIGDGMVGHNNLTARYHEPIVTMSNAAARTSRVRLGFSVLVLPYRHPIVMAKMLSTLDVLSGGRIILGTGVGWAEQEFAALGVPFNERGRLTDEALAIMNELWTSESPSFSGKHYSFSGIQFEPKPVQRPRIPTWVGGSGRAAMRRVAQFGDAWLTPSAMTLEETREASTKLREQWQAFGREGEPEINFTMWSRLREMSRGGPRRMGVGTPDELVEDLRELEAAGIGTVVLDLASGADEERFNSSLETYSREILPQFR